MRFIAGLIMFLMFTLSYATTMTVGVPFFNPPFIMKAGSAGQLIGFDADIMNEICRRLSVECKFKTLTYGDVFNKVTNGQVDVGIGAITISLARDKQFTLSLPYLQSFGQFIVKNNSAIQSTKDFLEKKFGVVTQSVYQDLLTTMLGSNIKILTYDFQSQMLTALDDGDVDALLIDKVTADYWYANGDNAYRLIGKRIPYGYGYGIIAAKGKTDLMSQINAALLAMQADGTYIKIYSTYFSGSAL